MKNPIIYTLLAIFLTGCSTQKIDNSSEELDNLNHQCQTEFSNPTYDLIRDKIELYPTSQFPKKSDYSRRPNKKESDSLESFLSLYSKCHGGSANILLSSYPSIGIRSMQQTQEISKGIRLLIHGKITWGFFTEKRYEIMNMRASHEINRSEEESKIEIEKSRENIRRQALERERQINSAKPKVTTCNTNSLGTTTCTTK